MNTQVPAPKRASWFEALWAAFSERAYFSFVLPHDLAAELGSEQIASAHRSGQWPAASWAQETLERARLDRDKLKRSMFRSATLASLFVLLAVVVAAALGKVHPSLSVDPGKVSAGVGAWLLAWAAFLPLYPARPSYRTDLLHEVAHLTLIKALLVLGTSLAALGALWWQ